MPPEALEMALVANGAEGGAGKFVTAGSVEWFVNWGLGRFVWTVRMAAGELFVARVMTRTPGRTVVI